jgi:hypothetical protein
VTAEPTRTIRVQNFLGKAAGGCNGALNSFLIVFSDKCGPSATGQYTFDGERSIGRSQATSIAQKRSSGGATHSHGSANACKDRAMSIQQEETACMTLICHDCAGAPDSQTA